MLSIRLSVAAVFRRDQDTSKRAYLPGGSDDQESACSAEDPGSISGSGRSPGEGNGYPLTPVFLPGESHGQRSLVGCSS